MAQTKKLNPKKLPLLTVQEKQRLRAQIDEEQAYAASINRPPDNEHGVELAIRDIKSTDASDIQARIRRKQRALDVLDPANYRLTGRQRQDAVKRMKWLEEWLSEHMLTVAEMNAFPSAQDPFKQEIYEQACRRSKECEVGNPMFSRHAEEYKTLARLLEPEDPTLCNIERLRRRGESGRHFQTAGG